MKKYIYISLAAICLSVIAGCRNADLPKPTDDQNKQAKVTQKMLFVGYTPYSKILECDCEKIGYLSTKQNSIDPAEISFALPSAFERDVENTNGNVSAAPPRPRNIGFAVNGNLARELAANMTQPNNQYFGTNVKFSLFNTNTGSNNGVMKAPGNDDNSTTMYVPELLEITSPHIATADELLPYCYYKDFVLGWNADPQNENGLVVVVEWNGTDLYGNEYKEYVRNADILTNDNGRAVLNNALFDGIPHGALVNIQLIRGNIANLDGFINGEGVPEEFTLVAGSQVILPIILVREIK